MSKVTKDTLIGEVLQINPGVATILTDIGMHCIGCPGAQMESLEMACNVHEADVDALVANINAYLEGKES